jgi:Fic family protein
VRELHHILCRDLPNVQPGRYRTEIMLHRVYLHDIHRPDRISYHLNKLVRDLYGEAMQSFHPIKRACSFHRNFMHIFPFYQMTGKLGRLLMNHVLISNDYFPCVMHVKDRQRYYQALRDSLDDVRLLAVESMENTLRHSAESIS